MFRLASIELDHVSRRHQRHQSGIGIDMADGMMLELKVEHELTRLQGWNQRKHVGPYDEAFKP
jgi:hypothetical protein